MTPPHADEPHVVVDPVMEPARRRALKAALLDAAKGQPGGPWKIRAAGTLVYKDPAQGTWWLSVTLTSAAGHTHSFLVDPDHQTPAFVADLAGRVLRGELLTAACSSCGKVRLHDGSWHDRPKLKKHARLSHAVCPECAEKLYPDQVRQISRRAKRRT